MKFHQEICVFCLVVIIGVLPGADTQKKANVLKVRDYLSKLPTVTECSKDKKDHGNGLCNFYGTQYFISCNGINRKMQVQMARNGGTPRHETIQTAKIPDVTTEEVIKFHPMSGQRLSEFSMRDLPYTLNFLDRDTYFTPLKEHLDALASLFNDHCRDSTSPLKFPIEIDTTNINPTFDCKLPIVDLFKGESTDDLQAYTFDAEDPIEIAYNRQDRKYVSRHEGEEWESVDEPKHTWEIVLIVKREMLAHSVMRVSLEDVRFYLKDFKSVLGTLWSKVTKKPTTFKYYYKKLFKKKNLRGSFRIGKQTIIEVEKSPRTAKSEDGKPLGFLMKVIGDKYENSNKKGSSVDIYFYKDDFYEDEGTKMANMKNYYMRPVDESSEHKYVVHYEEFEDFRLSLLMYTLTIRDYMSKQNDNREVVRVEFIYREKFVIKAAFAVKEGAYLFKNLRLVKKLLLGGDLLTVIAQPDPELQTWVIGSLGRTTAKRWLTDVLAVGLEPYTVKTTEGTSTYNKVTANQNWTIRISKPSRKRIRADANASKR